MVFPNWWHALNVGKYASRRLYFQWVISLVRGTWNSMRKEILTVVCWTSELRSYLHWSIHRGAEILYANATPRDHKNMHKLSNTKQFQIVAVSRIFFRPILFLYISKHMQWDMIDSSKFWLARHYLSAYTMKCIVWNLTETMGTGSEYERNEESELRFWMNCGAVDGYA